MKTKKTKKVKAPDSAKATSGKPEGKRELDVFDINGKKVSTVTLPERIFGAQWRPDLVHQVTTALAANLRQNRAHTKTREEVAGGGKKPWKQKGTGQARHGSTRSPLWRHGGITFGPRVERDYHEKINRKMKTQALISVLSRKAKDGELILVDKFAFGAPKTKEAITALVAVSKAADAKFLTKQKNAALVAFSKYDANQVRSFRNLENIATEEVRNLNPLEVLSYKYLIIENPAESFATLSAKK